MRKTIIIHFVDGDIKARAEAARIALALGHHAEVYASIAELAKHPPQDGIIIARDDVLPGGAPGILDMLCRAGIWLPLVVASYTTGISRVVEAIRAGALDYLTLPLEQSQLGTMLARVTRLAVVDARSRKQMIEARRCIMSLSDREREVLDLLVNGSSNKLIARELEISPRTVEIHRANMMDKLGAKHVAEVVKLRLEARLDEDIGGSVPKPGPSQRTTPSGAGGAAAGGLGGSVHRQ